MSKKQGDFSYFKGGIVAGSHTPVYKMHRYFARRPHNVFRSLIEAYSKPGDVILDPFCGGGVALVEGLASNRKVIAVDTNQLATFVSDCQTTPISLVEYELILDEIEKKFANEIEKYYLTTDRETSVKTPVRWYELAYKVKCTSCNKETLLSNNLKLERNGKLVNGKYVCKHCGEIITAVDSARTSEELLSVTYRSTSTGKRVTVEVDKEDIKLLNSFEKNFNELMAKNKLWFPQDEIPSEWDRQQEDCLHRKEVKKFSDFYTKRLLYSNAYLLKLITDYKKSVDPDLYKILLFTFSAVVRYTNNMTVSAGNWMDGRPVAWAKHAFWIPNQFVEVNPIEYLQMRRKAIVKGLEYQQKIIVQNKKTDSYSKLLEDEATHMIFTQSSEEIDIPPESVDAIITDPPYGSNVQYGELSHYWLVWLKRDLQLNNLFDLNKEILVNRKSKQKTYQDYEEGMYRVFAESYRVLKTEGVLTFTFNNKDIRSWYAVIKAAVRAGFVLEPDGVVYQDAIENYKNTAHTRFAGTVHGDFIYSFRKLKKASINKNGRKISRKELMDNIRRYLKDKNTATTSELYMVCIQQMIPSMLNQADQDSPTFKLDGSNNVDLTNLEELLNEVLEFNTEKKVWQKQR